MRAKVGISIPQFYPDNSVDLAVLDEYVQTAEKLGYQSGWVQEEILRSPALDAVGLLLYVAARTHKMVLGTAVLITPVRNPLHLAKALLTLDHFSGGRLIVGVGLGTHTTSYPAFGIPVEKRAARFAEGIQVMKQLWTGESLNFEGEYFKFHGERMLPLPKQRPHPPIYFGGSAPVALARAARMGDGWIGGRTPTPDFKKHVEDLRRLVAEHGKDPVKFPIAKRVYIQLDSNKPRIEERLVKWFGDTYADPEAAKRSVIYGGVDECVDRVAEVIEAGCGELIFNPIYEQREQMEIIAKELIPKLS
jgi:probable F420-dependent oxidoreductase